MEMDNHYHHHLHTEKYITDKEVLELIKNLPKSETSLEILGGPRASPASRPQNLLDMARATTAKKLQAPIRRELGKRINARNIDRQTRKPSRRNQKKYNLLIELSTNVTGKHSIFYSSQLKSLVPNSMGPWQYPTVSRNPDQPPPYSRPRDKKNEEWMRISKEIRNQLKELFHKGNELVFQNPGFPGILKKYFVFRINSYQWRFLPRHLDNLTGKDYFKFYITYNPMNPRDPNLYIVLKLHLVGKIMKNRNKIDPIRALPMARVENKKILEKASSFCGKRIQSIKDIFTDTWTNSGIFNDSTSEKFEKKMKMAKKSISVSRFLKQYSANKSKALAYWEQEYYCRQATNFNAGITAGWPNINVAPSRYPYDPWTLQPGIIDTFMQVTRPNNTIPFVNLQATNAVVSGHLAQMQAAYNALPEGHQRPPWPIPFSPFGMALKPIMVLHLFKRINNLINEGPGEPDRVVLGIPENVQNAALALRGRQIKDKLPNLLTYDAQAWNNLFILYEYVLYFNYLDDGVEPVLESYDAYPILPPPVDDQPFGVWIVNSKGDKQWAIPVNTNSEPWPTIRGPNADEIAAVQALPAIAPRYRVTWQQVKNNEFYVKEAKKWANWMVLSHPFPIPGFSQYSKYILLRQNYILYKLNASSPVPIPAAAPPLFPEPLPDNELRTQFPLPAEKALNRSPAYINPYALTSFAPNGWNENFVEWFNPPDWNIVKQLFTGPPANNYPSPVWPANNMRVGGVNAFIPVFELPITYPRRIGEIETGGWRGGRKRTLKKRRRKRKKKTLKKRRKLKNKR